jgi:hypothetical protein
MIKFLKREAEKFLRIIKEDWRLYLGFIVLTTIHSLIFKIDPNYSMMIILFSFLMSLFIFGTFAYWAHIKEKSKQ